MFGDVWFYAITGDEAESMDEHVQRGKLVIGTVLSMLRSGASVPPNDDAKIDESEQDGADQPATAPQSKPKGEQDPKSESEMRPEN